MEKDSTKTKATNAPKSSSGHKVEFSPTHKTNFIKLHYKFFMKPQFYPREIDDRLPNDHRSVIKSLSKTSPNFPNQKEYENSQKNWFPCNTNPKPTHKPQKNEFFQLQSKSKVGQDA